MKAKVRRRYLALKIDSNEKFESKEFMDTVWNNLLRLYGEYGASKAGLTLVDYDMEKGLAVIRAAHTEVEKVRAAIASVTEINTKPVAVHVLTISGSLKTLRRKLRTTA
jgi:ribonuclease P/MRP protein subunit POP5